MELLALESGLDKVASAGCVLNHAELLLLRAELASLRAAEGFREIFFWGKIFGQQSDYYIAYALNDAEEFEFPSKVFYCAGPTLQFEALRSSMVPFNIQNFGELSLQAGPELRMQLHFEEDPEWVIQADEEKEGAGVVFRKVNAAVMQQWKVERHQTETTKFRIASPSGLFLTARLPEFEVYLTSEQTAPNLQWWELKEGSLSVLHGEAECSLAPQDGQVKETVVVIMDKIKDQRWMMMPAGARKGKPSQATAPEDAAIMAKLATGPFTGDRKHPLEPPPAEDAADGEEAEKPEGEKAKIKKFTEADRLEMTILDIDFDCGVAPRGAYGVDVDHRVVRRPDFSGLGPTQATSLSSYVHFRAPASLSCRRALARTDAMFSDDILDPIDEDLPRGCWTLREEPCAVCTVSLRSLSWQGYVAYHVPRTTLFGGVYFGHGRKALELPFLL